MATRRDFLKASMMATAGLVLPGTGERLSAAGAPAALLDPATVPKFAHPLKNPLDPDFIFSTNSGTDGEGNLFDYEIGMGPTTQNILPAGAGFPSTSVWGYGQNGTYTYPGKTLIAQRDTPIRVHWTNNLPSNEHLLEEALDRSLHWCYSLEGYAEASIADNGIPVVAHAHGLHAESESDGLPEQFFTSNFDVTGPEWAKETYVYHNDQEAGTLWYHDHALGITRLNVYAGLAGFYILRDSQDTGAADNPLGLPHYPYEVPIVIQDRLFDVNGELVYPTSPPGSILPEMFGDVIVVNGRAWPKLDAEPRYYRFRFLNGSDSRFYNLWLTSGSRSGDGPQIYVIGTDDGLLAAPQPVDKLTIGPGERYDVMVNFAGWEGERLILRNNARSPFPKGGTVDPQTTGQIMAVDVGTNVTDSRNNALPTSLRSGGSYTVSGTVTKHRGVALFEGTDAQGRLQPMLGTLSAGSMLWHEDDYPITESPELDDVEIWEIHNATPDAHPIHLHLVAFEVLERQKIRYDLVPKDMETADGVTVVDGGFEIQNVQTLGQPRPAEPWEQGPKDTIIAYPDEVVRVKAKFDRPGRYVWHCHILSHEDHEMMRPYSVQQPTIAQKSSERTATESIEGPVEEVALEKNVPNPFAGRTEIRFAIPEAQQVRLEVYDLRGRRVAQLVNGHLDGGVHRVEFDGSGLASGVYFSQLTAGSVTRTGRMMLVQ